MSPTNLYETPDKNLAALLRSHGVPQAGTREVAGLHNRPLLYFQFEDAERCETLVEDALLGRAVVNYQRFVAEQNAVLDQIHHSHKRRLETSELPPFMARRPHKRG